MCSSINILKSAAHGVNMSIQDIAAIERQIERLKNRRTAVLAKDAATERRRRTRQNIIVGAWIQQHRPEMILEIQATLTRDQDRAVFRIPGAGAQAAVDIVLLPEGDEGEAAYA
jgi:hypothetical protein